MARDWGKIRELTREVSGLALELKQLARAYVLGTSDFGNIDVDKVKVLDHAIVCFQSLDAKMSELKTEWQK
jgi:hypothetical protein